jgi:thymidine phosphorylase
VGADTEVAADPGIDTILTLRREGGVLSAAQIEAFVQGVVDGSVTRAQAAAFLAFTAVRGMSDAETAALTRAMTASGDQLSWPGLDGPFVDKHSTGGVGDKVSLVLAPLWAELGARVPMISGRGLEHTGGTLDKLEAIPGFRADLSLPELRRTLTNVGCFISGQTGELAPADRVLYALRNETCTVPSIPLITASILSKKLAEGLDRLVLDVKWGSGAFMKTRAQAAELSESLVRVGEAAGVRTSAVLTETNAPLGRTVGNALEVEEAVACLKGEPEPQLAALVCALIGDPRAAEVLASGAAYERFARMVRGQGGDPDAPLRGGGCRELVIEADRDGVLAACDALSVGRAAFRLGAGRRRAADPVHPGVGIRVHAWPGDRVVRGQPLLTLVHDDTGLDAAAALARAALRIDGA